MEYTINGTQGCVIRCGSRAYRLAEDMRTECNVPTDQGEALGIICLEAQVVPVDDPDTEWQYIACWSVLDRNEWDALSAPGCNLGDRKWFDGIIGTTSTDMEDDMIAYDADGNIKA